MFLSRTKPYIDIPAVSLWLTVKRLLPSTLFGRSLLILVMPAILSQAVETYVYYDRVNDSITRRLAQGVAGDIALMVETRQDLNNKLSDTELFADARRMTQLYYHIYPNADLHTQAPIIKAVDDPLDTALKEQRLPYPYQIERNTASEPLISIKIPEGLLVVTIPRNRLFTSVNNLQFFLWMFGTGVVTYGVASIFLRNQVRSLRRLAVAADAFGKGRDMPDFRPSGAAEIRQAAAAFLVMRARIQRQITQRTEMLAGVSHDLRTPLTRMKLELELLGDGEDTQGLKADVDEMEQMIAGYLSFVRGEGNEAPAVIDLVELATDAVQTARRGSSERISLFAPSELYLPLRREALRRCLMNLISNAVRYGGEVWVTIETIGQSASILIDDNGHGIPELQREEVFRPFFRLEASRNMKTGGVGLGLTIARDIARGHGGDLILESAPQGGLRARVTLPR